MKTRTLCPTCGETHYKKGYTMHDRIRCKGCQELLDKDLLHDTMSQEHHFHG